jgi:hypothetical protein
MRIIDYIYDYSIEIEKALWEIGDGDLRRRPQAVQFLGELF